MIVICTGCQARFRVADEKIGPRGAKVRCSRCQNVFVVKREATPAPAPLVDLDLTPGPPRPAPARDPFAPAGGAGASEIAFPGGAPGPSGPAPDPFAAAGLDAFEGSAPAAGDPFGAQAGPRQPTVKFPAGDLGRGALFPPGAGPAPDPFAPPADPFLGVPPTPTGSQRLPVTDLAQLLGAAPAPSPALAPALTPALASRPAPPPPVMPEPAAAPSTPAAFSAFGEDLTLEERKSGEHGLGFADPADVLSTEAGPTSFSAAFPPGVFDSLAPPAPGEESLSLATEPTPGPAGFARPAPSPAPQAPAEEPPLRPPPRARPEPEGDLASSAAAGHPGFGPRGRLRSAAVNALALVALVVVALALREVWRGGRLGPGAFRPSRLLEAIRGERTSEVPFELSEVRTGVYPQGAGAVLFVRGVVTCRPAAPVKHVRVEAELVRDGQVLAKGDVLAGALPSAEEVWRATDRAGLDALSGELAKRAPKKVGAGDRLEFLITLGDAPVDLAGTSVRVHAAAQGAREPGSPVAR